MCNLQATKHGQNNTGHVQNFFISSGGPSKLRLHGTSNPPSVIVERRRGLVPSFVAGSPTLHVDGSEDDEIRDEILRDIEVDITDGAHNEEDPDADIDELDFFSDED